MKARGHWTIAALFVVASGLPAAAQVAGGTGGGGLGGGGGAGGIGGTGPIGSPVGRNSIGGLTRPGDMGATGPGIAGGSSLGTGSNLGGSGLSSNLTGTNPGAVTYGAETSGGSGALTGRQPGGALGSGGANRSGNTGYNPQADLGINDPFAAAGTGVGGPQPGDTGVGSLNEALSQSPNTRPGLVNPANIPPSAMAPGGGTLDPLAGTAGVGGIGGLGAGPGIGAPAAGTGQPY